MKECDDPADCLADDRLSAEQRRMLAILLAWSRKQVTGLHDRHEETDKKLEEHLSETKGISQQVRQLHIAVWGNPDDPHRKDTGLMGLRNQICMLARLGMIAMTALGGMIAWVIHIIGELVKVAG